MAFDSNSAAPTSRRQFLKSSAVAAGSSLLAAPAIVSGRNLNEKLNIAIIGAGGRGASNTGNVSSENIVALCDVNANNLNRAATRHPAAKRFSDFRKLYEKPGRFDAVVVSCCEHTHAFATMPALKLGKHVYCEKPLTYNVEECRAIRLAAAEANVATQMGTQIHAGENYRRVVELIQAGAIGSVSEAHVWVGRAWGWHQDARQAARHGDRAFVPDRPRQTQAVPAGLDWDLWLGPAPRRPFHSVYVPGPKWYRWWDFGNGTMSDLGSHWIDLPFWALKLKAPSVVTAAGPPPHPEIAPASMQVTYKYEQQGEQPALSLSWYQGTNKPPAWTANTIPRWNSGVLFVGSRGQLLADYGKHLLLPEDEFRDYKRPDRSIPRSRGHHAEWIHACKTGTPTTCNFEYAGWLTEANHLGNVAYRVGQTLEWDAPSMTVTNVSDAERFIRRSYRKGWSLA